MASVPAGRSGWGFRVTFPGVSAFQAANGSGREGIMSGLFGRGLNAERVKHRTLSSSGDLGIIGGASAFNGLALAVARYECRTQAVMEVNMSKLPNAGVQCSLDLRRVRCPIQFANPDMTP